MNAIRSAARRLAHDPGFSLLAIATLALGIAANTAIFAVVNAVLLRPLPFPEPDRLVLARHSAPGLDLEGIGQSEATFLRYREHTRSFTGMAMFRNRAVALSGAGEPERLAAGEASAGFLGTLGVAPLAGRDLVRADELPGAPPVAILTDELWHRRFGADPAVVGRTIQLDGVAHEVIGIAPAGLRFPQEAELWTALELDPAEPELGAFGAGGVARLRPGVGLAAAEADLDRLIADLETVFPDDSASQVLARAGFTAEVESLRDAVVGDVAPRLWMLLGMVGAVLLIACANVANLFVVRGEARQRDVAVRAALGAGRGRLAAEALTETLLIAVAAGVVGLVGALGAVELLVRFGPADLPRLSEVAIDLRVMLFDLGVALAAGLAFGLLPLLRPRLRRLSEVLSDGGRGSVGGCARLGARRVLVAAQVAIALVLLVAAGLMVRSFSRLARVDLGFEPEGVLLATVALPEAAYPDDAAAARFYDELLERLRPLPGVASAGVTSMLPLGGQYSGGGHRFGDRPLEDQEVPVVLGTAYVSPGYLEALGVPLRAGRPLEPGDATHRTGAVLVSESLARQRWPGEDAVGQRIFPGRPEAGALDPWYTVVGVVGDVRDDLTEEPPEIVYYPLMAKEEGLWTVREATLVVRTEGSPLRMAGPIRSTLWSIDSSLPIVDVGTYEERVRGARAETAFTVVLLLIAAAVALALGTIGTFGVVSYLVALRRSEIGIRIALGARAPDVAGLVVREGLLVASAGGAVGLAAAAAMTRWMEAVLFEVSPLDPVTFAAVPAVLLLAVAAATWLPARRALRIDPALALRGS